MRSLRELPRRPSELSGRQRLLVAYGIGVLTVVVGFAVTYQWGMRELEGRPRPIYHAFNIVIETMTTTGYGSDAPWETPAMNALVATMQVSGIVIGFVTLRVLVIPLFERTPLNLDDRLTSKDAHVVVAEYRRDTEVLLDELEEAGIDYVLVESEIEEAKRLSDAGYQAINGDPERRDDLRRASIERASTLITDAQDRTASVVLTALEENEDLRVVSFTPSIRRKAALAAIGVDRSVSPHGLIGARLAEKATTPVAFEDADDAPVAIREVLVRRDSPLHGVRLGESPLRDHPEVRLVAGWFDGELRLSPDPSTRLTPNTVLVVAGPDDALDALSSEIAGVRTPRSYPRQRPAGGSGASERAGVDPETNGRGTGGGDTSAGVSQSEATGVSQSETTGVSQSEATGASQTETTGASQSGPTDTASPSDTDGRRGDRSGVVITGMGEGGRAALEGLPAATSVTTVDESPEAGADVTGDVTEPETLESAGVPDARSVIVTVDDDATALLTVAMARSLAPTAEVLVRVTDSEKTGPAFRAGADYVLSVQRVCARLVAGEVRGERVVNPVGQIRLVRTAGTPFAGQSLGEATAGDADWTLVGVVRDGTLRTEDTATIDGADDVFVAGSDEAIQAFEQTVEKT